MAEKHEADYNIIDWWKKVFLKNYANFSGRARRAEYWYYTLANILLIIPLYILVIFGVSTGDDTPIFAPVIGGVAILFFLASIIPSLAVTVRRLHDTNKSGWYYLISFVPFGSIVLLVWVCTEGDKQPNQYGDDPKNPAEPEFDFEQY